MIFLTCNFVELSVFSSNVFGVPQLKPSGEFLLVRQWRHGEAVKAPLLTERTFSVFRGSDTYGASKISSIVWCPSDVFSLQS